MPEETEIPFYSDPEFIDPTPFDPVDKDDVIIFLLEKVIKSSNENAVLQDTKMSENNSYLLTTTEKLETLIQQGSTGDSAIGDSNTQILAKLDTITANQHDLIIGANTVTTYGVVLIPLVIIIFLMWRLMSTFTKVY